MRTPRQQMRRENKAVLVMALLVVAVGVGVFVAKKAFGAERVRSVSDCWIDVRPGGTIVVHGCLVMGEYKVSRVGDAVTISGVRSIVQE